MIPAEAVEAAAIAMEDAALKLIGSDLGTTYRNEIAHSALEAAAPHMLAVAWDEGHAAGGIIRETAGTQMPHNPAEDNPYKSQP